MLRGSNYNVTGVKLPYYGGQITILRGSNYHVTGAKLPCYWDAVVF